MKHKDKFPTILVKKVASPKGWPVGKYKLKSSLYQLTMPKAIPLPSGAHKAIAL